MGWIFVIGFCTAVLLGTIVIGKKSNILAIVWCAFWGIVFAVAFWPF